MEELRRREKEAGIEPDWEVDAFMKASTLQGKRQSIQTEYILNVLGLDVRDSLPSPCSSYLVWKSVC